MGPVSVYTCDWLSPLSLDWHWCNRYHHDAEWYANDHRGWHHGIGSSADYSLYYTHSVWIFSRRPPVRIFPWSPKMFQRRTRREKENKTQTHHEIKIFEFGWGSAETEISFEKLSMEAHACVQLKRSINITTVIINTHWLSLIFRYR